MHTQAFRILAALIALIGTPLLATAQTATAPSTPTVGTFSSVTSKLSNQFADFAGSPENSTALVNGLRTGTSITLTSPTTAPGGTTPLTTTFTPPTKPMGYGNVKIAMSLAQTSLAQQGITNPTPEQLQGALMGTSTTVNGVTTQTQGVLQMRADGMGWGQIANSMGYKLGAVMSGRALTPANTTGVTTSASHGKPATTAGKSNAGGSRITTASGNTGAGHSKGIVTGASGASGSSAATAGRGNAGSHGSKGIVTAAGVGSGGGAVNAMGHGAGGRSGIVTASSGAGSKAGGASAGKGNGKH